MPQLDPSSFLTQLFWLAITITILYLVLWRVALPRLAEILQERQEHIDDDLRRAEEIEKDAEKALVAYEKTMQEGRDQAQSMLCETIERKAAEAAQRNDALSELLTQQAAEAEQSIAAAQQAAQASIADAAVEVTRATVSRLLGSDIGEAEATEAVEAAQRERG